MEIDNLVDDLKYLTLADINTFQNDMEIDSLIDGLKSLTTAEIINYYNNINNNNNPSETNRCKLCRRKVGLLGFSCRCGGLFCGAHRHPEVHPCSFDYKKAGRAALEKEINPLFRPDKIKYRV